VIPRREQRDIWRRVRKARLAAGDKEGAARALVTIKLLDGPGIRYFDRAKRIGGRNPWWY
jgi:hypothetical protein